MSAGFDLLQFLRFGLVGGGATAVHLGVVLAVEATLTLPLLVVHGLGWLCAVSVSFVGHHVYTFASDKTWKTAAGRFLAVSAVALLASTAITALGAVAGLPRLASLLVAAASVPLLAYIANRDLVF